jgi:hypothetical protein
MQKETLLGVDQYGTHWHGIDAARPKASLLEMIGARTATRMFVDTSNGSAKQIGYVVSPTRGSGGTALWVSLYRVTEWNDSTGGA